MSDDTTPQPPRVFGVTCSKCGTAEPGPGGILCPSCKTAIESAPLYPEPGTEVKK